MRLNGSSQYLDFNPQAYEFGTVFSFAGWINLNPDGKNGQVILANKHGGPNKDGFALYVNKWDTNDRSVVLETGNGSAPNGVQFTSPAVVAPGKWQHIGLVYSRPSKSVRVYVNGVEVPTSSQIRHDFSTKLPAHFGNFPNGGGPLNGMLDDLRIYQRTLTVNEMEALARMLSPPSLGTQPSGATR